MARNSIVLGNAGAYSSWLRHAQRYVAAHAIREEVGPRGCLGAQEDLFIGLRLSLSASIEA